jgi:hypothetical protein
LFRLAPVVSGWRRLLSAVADMLRAAARERLQARLTAAEPNVATRIDCALGLAPRVRAGMHAPEGAAMRIPRPNAGSCSVYHRAFDWSRQFVGWRG